MFFFLAGGGGSGGHSPPGATAFLLVTDNRRSRLDSPFCVITQHLKLEFWSSQTKYKDKQCLGTDNAAIKDFIKSKFQTAQ